MQLKYYRVSIIESERGWGQRTDETLFFRDEAEAKAYVKKYNSSNTATSVPDWYMYATDPQTEYVDEKLAALIVEDSKPKAKKRKPRAGLLVG